MTLAEHLKNFEDRGFRAETAAVWVFVEEALLSLFTSLTDTFVLFGGATLVLLYGSQRHSGDIDLLPNCGDPNQQSQNEQRLSPLQHHRDGSDERCDCENWGTPACAETREQPQPATKLERMTKEQN